MSLRNDKIAGNPIADLPEGLIRDSINFIDEYLCIALGSNRYIHSLVDEIYEENPFIFYNSFLEGKLRKNENMKRLCAENEGRVRKVMGIFEWETFHNRSYTRIMRLIKKGYKFSYKTVEESRRVFDMDSFATVFGKYRGGVDKFSDAELFNHAVVSIWLSDRKGIKVDLSGNDYSKAFKEDCATKIADGSFRNKKLKELAANHKDEVSSLMKEYWTVKGISTVPVSVWLESITQAKVMEILKGHPLLKLVVDGVHERAVSTGTGKYQVVYGLLVGLYGLDSVDLTGFCQVDKETISDVVAMYCMFKGTGKIPADKEFRDGFIVSHIIIKCLTESYVTLKNLYLNDSQHKYYNDILERQAAIMAKDEQLAEAQVRSATSSLEQSSRIKELEDALVVAEKKLKQAQSELERREDLTKEVAALRSFVYELDNENEQVVSKVSCEEMTEFVQSKKVAVFGGHTNWIKDMKELLPKVRFIEREEIDRDFSFVHHLDAVFIFSHTVSHKLTNKLLTYVNRSNASLFYLKRNVNKDLTVSKMYEDLSKLS